MHDQRMPRRCAPALAPLIALVAVTSACVGRPRVNAIPRVGSLEIDGDIIVDPSGPFKGEASADALGLDDDDAVFQPRADLDWDRLHVTVQGYTSEFTGDGVADATLDFGDGNGVTVGQDVHSDIDLTLLTSSVTYDFFPGLPFDLGFGAGVGVIAYDVKIEAISGSGKVEADDVLPFPFLTVRLARGFGDFELVGLFNGVSFEYEDEKIDYYEADASLGWQIAKKALDLQLLAGYRYQSIDYEFDASGGKTGIDIDLEGPYVGLVLSF